MMESSSVTLVLVFASLSRLLFVEEEDDRSLVGVAPERMVEVGWWVKEGRIE